MLRENGADMPDSLVETLWAIIQKMAPGGRPGSGGGGDGARLQPREDAGPYKGLALPDTRDRVKEMEEEMLAEARAKAEQSAAAERQRSHEQASTRDGRGGGDYRDGRDRDGRRRSRSRSRDRRRDRSRSRDRDRYGGGRRGRSRSGSPRGRGGPPPPMPDEPEMYGVYRVRRHLLRWGLAGRELPDCLLCRPLLQLLEQGGVARHALSSRLSCGCLSCWDSCLHVGRFPSLMCASPLLNPRHLPAGPGEQCDGLWLLCGADGLSHKAGGWAQVKSSPGLTFACPDPAGLGIGWDSAALKLQRATLPCMGPPHVPAGLSCMLAPAQAGSASAQRAVFGHLPTAGRQDSSVLSMLCACSNRCCLQEGLVHLSNISSTKRGGSAKELVNKGGWRHGHGSAGECLQLAVCTTTGVHPFCLLAQPAAFNQVWVKVVPSRSSFDASPSETKPSCSACRRPGVGEGCVQDRPAVGPGDAGRGPSHGRVKGWPLRLLPLRLLRLLLPTAAASSVAAAVNAADAVLLVLLPPMALLAICLANITPTVWLPPALQARICCPCSGRRVWRGPQTPPAPPAAPTSPHCTACLVSRWVSGAAYRARPACCGM